MEIDFEIPLNPIPLARPRFGLGRVFDSQKNEKESYRWFMIKAMVGKRKFIMPITLEITFYMPIAIRRMSSTPEGEPHMYRPDLSNLVKFVEDAGLGILYDDDSVIARIDARKVYRRIGGVRVKIKEGIE